MMVERLLAVVVLVVFFITFNDGSTNPCTHATTCDQCIEAGHICYWCADIDFDDDAYRCNIRSMLHSCRNIQIKDGSMAVLTDSPFGSQTQIRPQKMKLSLRPGQVQRFKFSVKPAENYPVRIYYLMDMSNSMADDLKKLQTLGTKIANGIKTITTNFKLAFGTFVDKSVAPFVGLQADGQVPIPCANCVPTFGFKHVFDFNSDAKLFEKAVAEQLVSGNLDSPEGGFDALLQVAVCEKEIKWEPVGEARRIVIFVTDAPPHTAGDGRLGGIIPPNDGKCHLSKQPNSQYLTYAKTNDLDYPSLSQLKEVLKSHKVVPIFAVTADVKPVYNRIVDDWKDTGASIGTLERDSSNIVDLIHDTYQAITTTLRIVDNTAGTSVVANYKFLKGCQHGVEDDVCKGVSINNGVDIEAHFRILSCPSNWRNGETIKIVAPGFGEMEVEVELLCECDCVNKTEAAHEKCNGNGSLVCGICKCDAGRLGERCECDEQTQKDLTRQCVKPNTTNPDILCSGFGACVCGQCICNEVVLEGKYISGKYCECNNFGCPRFQGLLCGGPDKGVCVCGECSCTEDYLGDNCGHKNCTKGRKLCVKEGVVCSNNGECNCDHCECRVGCSGTHCETCVGEGPCHKHADCVRCQFEIAEYCEKCNMENVTYVKLDGNKTRACADIDYGRTDKCVLALGNGMEIHYVIDEDGEETTNTMEPCVVPIIEEGGVWIYAIIFGIIAGIVAVALILLLLWKITVTIYDRRELAKFNEAIKDPKWTQEDNPIYRKATSSFKNPMYKKGD